MQRIVDFLRGWTRLTVCGAFPERAINLFARNGVRFWAVEQRDGQTLCMTVLRRDAARASLLAGRAGCVVQVSARAGLPVFLGRFRRRYAFLAGLALSVLAVALLSGFVLTIEVTGNEQVPDAVILSELRRQGLRPGVYGASLDTRQISLAVAIDLPELSWITVNLHGTRAEVIVRECVPPPPLLEEEGVSDIVAGTDGLILRVDAVEGQALVREGDLAAAGETLISGTVTMEGPEYSGIEPTYLYVRAAGEVRARTWRTVRAAIPVTAQVKRYTGESRTRWSLTVFERRINFYPNGSIPWEKYDKISKSHVLTLPGGQRLPVFLTRETLRRWQPVTASINADAAQTLLRERLSRRLADTVGEDGRILRTDWSARIAGGLLTVTGSAECEEQIGVTTPARKIGETKSQ